MRTLRPKIVVVGGAALGLVAGAAVYGVVSTGATAAQTPMTEVAAVSLVDASVRTPEPAQCAKGAKLQNGVCIVHVERVVNVDRVVHVPAPAQAVGQTRHVVGERGSASSGHNPTQAGEHPTEAPDAEVEHELDEVDHESEGVEHESDEVDHESEDVEHE